MDIAIGNVKDNLTRNNFDYLCNEKAIDLMRTLVVPSKPFYDEMHVDVFEDAVVVRMKSGSAFAFPLLLEPVESNESKARLTLGSTYRRELDGKLVLHADTDAEAVLAREEAKRIVSSFTKKEANEIITYRRCSNLLRNEQ